MSLRKGLADGRGAAGDGVNAFQYTAWTADGLRRGLVERADAVAVSQWLEAQGWVPVEVRACRARPKPEADGRRRNGVRLVDLVMLSRQLEVLLQAGVPLVRAIDVAAEQAQSRTLARALGDVKRSIEQGSLFSEALEACPAVFPEIFANMVRAGELGGLLPEMLARLGALLERESETRRRLRSAGSFPGMLIAELILAIMVLIQVVLPRFVGLFQGLGTDLPLPTRVLLAVNAGVERHGLLLLGILAGLGAGAAAALNTDRGRHARDALLLRLPILGPIHHRTAQSRFARVLSALLAAGIPLLTALEVSARAAGNRIVAKAVLDSRNGIREGYGLAESLEMSRVFTPLLLRMTAAGEETGKLDTLLERAAGYDDAEADHAIRNLSAAIEPALLLVLGGFVLLTALAVFMPMWD